MCKAAASPEAAAAEESFTEKGIKFTFQPDTRNFKCGQCGKFLKTRFTAKIHVFSHTKEKPFKCPFCPQSFSHRSTLVNHKKIHSEPEFQCPNCLAWFARKANLKRHLRVVHKVSAEDINKSIPKAKPGPRRKQPRVSRDIRFVPGNFQDMRFCDTTMSNGTFRFHQPSLPQYHRGELLPPVSFAEDAVVSQVLPPQNDSVKPGRYIARPQPHELRQQLPHEGQQLQRGDPSKPVKLCMLSDMKPAHHQAIRKVQGAHGTPTMISSNSNQVSLEFDNSEYVVPGLVVYTNDLPPQVNLPTSDPFMDTPLFPIVEPSTGVDQKNLNLEDLFLPWTD